MIELVWIVIGVQDVLGTNSIVSYIYLYVHHVHNSLRSTNINLIWFVSYIY